MEAALLEDIRAHDASVARLGLEIWIGSEPTFTDAASQEPCWLGQAEGADKEARARALLLALAPRLTGAVRLVRTRGRLYPGEPRPRFCMGALFGRPQGGPALPLAEIAGDLETLSEAPAPSPAEAWLTVTPDPGVVEANLAPAHDLATFARWCEEVYDAAAEARLSPVRFRYNGEPTDSGGGGQLTLGGPSPERSPFFLRPQLLPRLLRYVNRHPALSYAFAPECVGSAGQGPRADEGVRERFEELPVALDRLAARGDAVTPDELWGTLAPLLVDSSGNSHRAELNVEKLWNPWMPDRGKLGLVELRSLRMPPTAAQLAALGALFRAVAARLASAEYDEPLVDWGGSLHELFGLPCFLARDLEEVLADLEEHGLGLGPALRAELVAPPEPVARLELPGAALEVAPARAFWPLLGDVASQERSGARLVDSSSARLQLLVTAAVGEGPGTVSAAGWLAPLRRIPGDDRRHVTSVLYRAFTPSPGLHPGLPAVDPLVLTWRRGGRGLSLALHGWRPGGGAYDGLPLDADEARRRRRERAVVGEAREAPEGRELPARTAAFTLDLRRAPGPLAAAPPALAPRAPLPTAAACEKATP